MKIVAQSITRRALLKRMVLLGGGATVVGVGGDLGWRLLNPSPGEPLDAEQLARRERERPHDGQRWLTTDEYALVAALGAVIIPTDGTEPGATEAGVAELIDRMLAQTPRFHISYAEGLLALDNFAQARDAVRSTWLRSASAPGGDGGPAQTNSGEGARVVAGNGEAKDWMAVLELNEAWSRGTRISPQS